MPPIDLALALAAASAGLLIVLLGPPGRAEGEAPALAGADLTEAWALLLAGGTVLLLVLLTEYESNWIWAVYRADSGQLDTLCIAGTAAITAWVLLAAMLLRTVTVRLRLRRWPDHPAVQGGELLWRRLSVFIRGCP